MTSRERRPQAGLDRPIIRPQKHVLPSCKGSYLFSRGLDVFLEPELATSVPRSSFRDEAEPLVQGQRRLIALVGIETDHTARPLPRPSGDGLRKLEADALASCERKNKQILHLGSKTRDPCRVAIANLRVAEWCSVGIQSHEEFRVGVFQQDADRITELRCGRLRLTEVVA